MEGHRRAREDAAPRPPGLSRPGDSTARLPIGNLRKLLRSWRARVAVRGHSMAPRLLDGDWLLVDPDAYRVAPPRLGDLVVAASSGRLVVKRVAGLSPSGDVELSGDAPSGGDHDHDVVVTGSALQGRPWFRYWPPRRMGRVR